MNKTVKETAKIWGTKTSNIISLCNAGWIPLSEKNKGKWCIPDNTKKPPFDHKEGCKLLKKIELYQCGAYKEALIINNDVEINRLKYMINNGIIKCDESKTNTLVSILGNSEITNLGNKILEYEKPKKLQSILSNVLKYLLMVAAVIGITFDSIAEEIIFESFRPTATYFAEKKLSEIRVGFTEQYVESKIGEPKTKRIIAYNDTAFLQTIDTNDYYTIICYYNQEAEEMVGYMLIGNDPMLNYQTNRSSLKLFEHTVVESRELLKKEGISGNLIVEEKKRESAMIITSIIMNVKCSIL